MNEPKTTTGDCVGFDKTQETVCLVFTLFRHFTSSAFLISINVSGEVIALGIRCIMQVIDTESTFECLTLITL